MAQAVLCPLVNDDQSTLDIENPFTGSKLWANEIWTPNGSAIAGLIKPAMAEPFGVKITFAHNFEPVKGFSISQVLWSSFTKGQRTAWAKDSISSSKGTK